MRKIDLVSPDCQTLQRSISQEINEYDKFELQYYDVKKGDILQPMVNIGEGCYVQAEVQAEQVRSPYLHIGQGIHVQFDRESEMLEFIENRKAFLSTKAEYLSSKIEMMRQDVDQVCNAFCSFKSLVNHILFFTS